jgi:hypothetical protein
LPLALAIAVIWTVHPVQTEAVTYISQRAESLMGLFYLLTLYCFIRGVEGRCQVSGVRYQEQHGDSRFDKLKALSQSKGDGGSNSVFQFFSLSAFWLPASVTACLLGSMCKEIIVTAPVMVFLYDRTFVAGSFRKAWQQRWPYYLGLASMWLLLTARLRLGLHQQGVGFDQDVTLLNYALTSCRSVVLYIKLAVWPHPLVFDYGTDAIHHATSGLYYVPVLIVLIIGLVVALWRWPAIGFASAWFFVILSPTTSVVPVAFQPMAESRMYLSLAAVISLIALGLYTWVGRRSLIIFAAITVGLGCLTIRRNEDYRSALAIWSDTDNLHCGGW